MLGLSWPIIDRRRFGRSLAVCCRVDGGDAVVDDMLLRTAGKSAPYAGEMVFSEPHDAVRRHLPF